MSSRNHSHGRAGAIGSASPFGWSAGRRLACGLAASAALWLAVAWALEWL
jgi:hypothetical protein